MNKDLTAGNPRSVLWRFTLPLFGSVIFQQLYNIADSFVAGKFIGDHALAAVGNSYEITLIYLAFAFGCNTGCSVITANLFGAGKRAAVKTAVYTTYLFTAALCAVLTAFGFLLGRPLLVLMHTDPGILADSLLYLRIYTAGLFFLFFYNISTGIFSALGDSVTPFCFLAVSSVSNIFMDIWFVRSFGMGVAGVAWATFLCQGVSCLLATVAVLLRLRKLPHDEAEKPQLFSRPILKEILRVGVPSTIQQSFVSVGNLFIQSFVNTCGLAVTAGYSAAIKINNFAITSICTLGNAMSNYTAQNLGAGKKERVRAGFRAGTVLGLMIAVFFSAVYVLFSEPLIGFFRNENSADVLRVGKMFLLIVAPFYLFPALKVLADGLLRGAKAMIYFMVSTFYDLTLRVVLAYVFCTVCGFGYVGIWCAWPIGWVLSTLLSLFFYKKGVWLKTEENKDLQAA